MCRVQCSTHGQRGDCGDEYAPSLYGPFCVLRLMPCRKEQREQSSITVAKHFVDSNSKRVENFRRIGNFRFARVAHHAASVDARSRFNSSSFVSSSSSLIPVSQP